MPRYRATTEPAYPRGKLVTLLANELHKEDGRGEPMIIERRIGSSRRLHVIVVWEEWRNVPATERGEIIRDAYERADRKAARAVSIPMGVTLDEAMEYRLLPFSVVALARKTDGVSTKDIIEALREEGAALTRRGWQLRFPTRVLAVQVRDSLKERTGWDIWAVEEDLTTEND